MKFSLFSNKTQVMPRQNLRQVGRQDVCPHPLTFQRHYNGMTNCQVRQAGIKWKYNNYPSLTSCSVLPYIVLVYYYLIEEPPGIQQQQQTHTKEQFQVVDHFDLYLIASK